MTTKEKSVIQDSVKLVFDWMKARSPGRVVMDWSIATQPVLIVINLVLPTIQLTPEELRFLPVEDRVFSLDGSTPPSFRPLDQARLRLSEIGGAVSFGRSADKEMFMELSVPARGDQPEDVVEKITVIRNEIINELQ